MLGPSALRSSGLLADDGLRPPGPPTTAPADPARQEFDETATAGFEILRRRLLRWYRFRVGAMLIMIVGSIGLGAFLLALPAQSGGFSVRGLVLIGLGAAALLLYRKDLDISRRQATQTVVLKAGKIVLRNLPPSGRRDLQVGLESVVRVELLAGRKVGPSLEMRYRESGAEKDASHHCHLVVDRERLRTALSLALPGKVTGRGWEPPAGTPDRAAKLEVSRINR